MKKTRGPEMDPPDAPSRHPRAVRPADLTTLRRQRGVRTNHPGQFIA
jgi:hypothetical protein